MSFYFPRSSFYEWKEMSILNGSPFKLVFKLYLGCNFTYLSLTKLTAYPNFGLTWSLPIFACHLSVLSKYMVLSVISPRLSY